MTTKKTKSTKTTTTKKNGASPLAEFIASLPAELQAQIARAAAAEQTEPEPAPEEQQREEAPPPRVVVESDDDDAVTVLRPGWLVVLKTKIEGGVTYAAETETHEVIERTERTAWRTEKIVDDIEEYEAAKRAGSKAITAIRRVCAKTAFGFLCPEADLPKLRAAAMEARGIAREHNKGAKHTRLVVNIFRAHIASTDEEATEAIAGELASLLEEMENGIVAADPERIREAARRANAISVILAEQEGQKVSAAVEEARAAANAIAKRIVRGGEKAELVVQQLARKELNAARFAFIDMETHAGEKADAAAAVNAQRFANIVDEQSEEV